MKLTGLKKPVKGGVISRRSFNQSGRCRQRDKHNRDGELNVTDDIGRRSVIGRKGAGQCSNWIGCKLVRILGGV